jgi:hypothetical protein
MTKDWGIMYWRHTFPSTHFPQGTFAPVRRWTRALPVFPQPLDSTTLAGYVDAAHATDLTTRRSITGLAFMLCGRTHCL